MKFKKPQFKKKIKCSIVNKSVHFVPKITLNEKKKLKKQILFFSLFCCKNKFYLVLLSINFSWQSLVYQYIHHRKRMNALIKYLNIFT